MSVFLIAEHKDGQLKRVTLELLGELLKQGVEPTTVLLGTGSLDGLAAEIGKKGGSKVAILEHAELFDFSTEGYANALHAYLAPHNPTAVITGATSSGKNFLPRLAAKFSAGIATDCTAFKIADQVEITRPVYGGKCTKTVKFTQGPAFFSVRPNVLPAPEDQPKEAQVEKVAADPGTVRAKVIETSASENKTVDLTEADIIISGGRSLKNAENFQILQECADTIGAAVGASRAAVDAGYAAHDIQVGQTGKTVSPKLYIACGISGAIQHLAGMRTSKYVVAINKDPEAPIFSKADYGIVGDLFEVVPKLTEEFKKLKAQS